MQNVGDIFTLMGGTGAVARILDIKHSTASEMRRRGSIPVRYWPALIEGAAAIGADLDSDILVKAHVAPASAGEAA